MKPVDPTTALTETTPSATAGVSLLFIANDTLRLVALREGERLLAGRLEPADVVIDHPSVSRRHASFSMTQGTLKVQDEGAKNGVVLNGVSVRSAELASGDCVRLGEVEVWIGNHAELRDPPKRKLHPRRFSQFLDDELERTRFSRRPVHVLVLKHAGADESDAVATRVLKQLRSIDRVCEYAPHLLLCLLLEREQNEAKVLAETLRAAADTNAQAALVTAPPGPMNAEALIAMVVDGVQMAPPSTRVDVCDPTASSTVDEPVMANPAMIRLFELATRTAQADLPLLISGETGAGKEVIAHAFHTRSLRRDKAFCAVNCAAIAPTLLESVLFGHERGAFTGADKRALGLFEQAEGGSIFLDEIGELSPPAQSALLRVLESRRIRRVGGSQEIAVNVRVIAATHRNLREMVAQGSFREDLLYRLEGLTVRVPPLRERLDELDALTTRFLTDAAAKWSMPVRQLTASAREAMRRYAWPGNVRQLRNAVERAAAVCLGQEIEIEDLPEYLFEREGGSLQPVSTMERSTSLVDDVRSFEAKLIRDALHQSQGNRSLAARLLGVPRRTLGGKIKDLGLE